MKSYLSLVSISAKRHRRRNRMTLFCIIIAVFLVTGVFSMADAGVQMEKQNTIINHGNWHISVSGLSEEAAQTIAGRSDVAAVSWYETANFEMHKSAMGTVGELFLIDGRKTALCGVSPAFVSDIMYYFNRGAKLDGDNEIILTENAKELLGVNIGDSVTLNTPSGSREFIISGFRLNDSKWADSNGGEDSALLVGEEDIGAFINIKTFRAVCGSEQPVLYIRFKAHTNIKRAFAEIKSSCGIADEGVHQNKMLLMTLGYSDSAYVMAVYGIAAFLFILILMAGVFMISGSLNSSVVQRSQFFGMMRCIGAGREQIIRFVRLEALNWCKTAIPAGIMLGTVFTWALCAALKYCIGGEFAVIPVFRLSVIGIVSGVVVGLLTVLLAARSPAKRASRVSPAAAVLGNTGKENHMRRAANTGLFKIETVLGINHAVSERKNLILMTCSFGLSIIMFLCFSVLVEFFGYMLPEKSYAADVSIVGENYSNVIDASLLNMICGMDGVKEVFGRSTEKEIAALFSRPAEQNTLNLISYDDLQLDWLVEDDDLRKGSDVSKVHADSSYVLTIYDKSNPLQIGDKVWICGEELEIAGILKMSPFSNDGTTDGQIDLICSMETFERLTGESRYAIIDIQMEKDADDTQVEKLSALAKETGHAFRDRRGEADRSFFYAFALILYGFLFIIALISVFNIINSISMSVSARTKQYGAMRAVGMDGRQITKMILAESYTYAFCGCIFGCALGLLASKIMYEKLITAHFGAAFGWEIPVAELLVILLMVMVSAASAVYAPSKRIRKMAVTETINEL